MKIMVGIDLHSNNALCGLMDESDQRLVHKKLPCDLTAILQLLEPYKDPFMDALRHCRQNYGGS